MRKQKNNEKKSKRSNNNNNKNLKHLNSEQTHIVKKKIKRERAYIDDNNTEDKNTPYPILIIMLCKYVLIDQRIILKN